MPEQDLSDMISNFRPYGETSPSNQPLVQAPIHHTFLFISVLIAIAAFVTFFSVYTLLEGENPAKLSDLGEGAPPPLPDDNYEPILSSSSANGNQPPSLPGFR